MLKTTILLLIYNYSHSVNEFKFVLGGVTTFVAYDDHENLQELTPSAQKTLRQLNFLKLFDQSHGFKMFLNFICETLAQTGFEIKDSQIFFSFNNKYFNENFWKEFFLLKKSNVTGVADLQENLNVLITFPKDKSSPEHTPENS